MNIAFYRQKIRVQRYPLLYFIGSCVLFVVLVLFSRWLEPDLSRDGVFYLQMVEVWLREGSCRAMLTHCAWMGGVPAFPLYLVKILAECGISPEVAGVGISMCAGSTLPFLVYLMAQEIQSDKRVALAAALLMTFNPAMIELAREVQRDMLYIGLCGWAIFFGMKGLLLKKVWPWIPAGILGALSALTRYETFELIPILLVTFLIFGLKKTISWKKICQQSSIFTVACVLTGFCMILIMGTLDLVVDAYPRYFKNVMTDFAHKITPGEKK